MTDKPSPEAMRLENEVLRGDKPSRFPVENSGHTAPAPRVDEGLSEEDRNYLEEVADGAWGHDPRARGLARDRLRALAAKEGSVMTDTPAPQPQPLPSQPAERDDRRAEVEAETRAERHAEYLDTMADVIMDSGAAGKLEAKSVMMKAAKFIRETASTVDTLTADRDRLGARVEELEKALADVVKDAEARATNGVVNLSHGVYCAARQALKGEHA